MKFKFLLLLAFSPIFVAAQAPQSFNYQAVVRDAENNVLAEQNISLRISICKGSENGEIVFSEIFLKNTGALGSISLVIGEGNIIQGSIADIDWSTDSYYLKVEIDKDAGSNYETMGASRLLSVPYALYALKSGESGITPALSIDYIVTQPSCFGDTNGSIMLSVVGGKPPYTIEWSDNSTSTSLQNIGQGQYIVRITDASGQFITRDISVSEPQELRASISKEDISCYGENDGVLTANAYGGSGQYQYLWSNGHEYRSMSNLSEGEYSLTITDSKGCSFESNLITITEPNPIIVNKTIQNVNCFNGSDGAISISITGGNQPGFWWEQGGLNTNLNNIPAGEYIFYVQDMSGCPIIKDTAIVKTLHEQTILNATQQNVLCKGESTGSINLQINPKNEPANFSWSNNNTSEDISNLSAGHYSVEVTDNFGCIEATNYNITEPSSSIAITSSLTDEVKGDMSGSIEVNANGGTSPYTFTWNTGDNTKDLFNIHSGNYALSITDQNGCIKTSTYSINNIESVTDIDGNIYDIVKINDQIWMKENLKTTKFNDGWIITSYEYPNNDESYVGDYGLLYPDYVMKNSSICPEGWKVPTTEEWDDLIEYLNGFDLAGGHLKETGTTYWREPNYGATNQSGFSARSTRSDIDATFWSLTDPNGNYNYYYRISYNNSSVVKSSSSSYNYEFSIRCIKE